MLTTCFLKLFLTMFFLTILMSIYHWMSGLDFSHHAWNLLTFHPPHVPSYLSAVLTPFSSSLPSFITLHPFLTVQWSPSQLVYSLHIFYLFSLFLYPCCIILSIHSGLSLFFPSLHRCLSCSIHPFDSLPSHFKKLSPCSLSKALFHPWG